MINLKRFELNNELAFQYYSECLEGANELSNEILKYVDFKSGNFFTYLPQNANLERIHRFPYGGILPQADMQKTEILGRECHFQPINNLEVELKEIICDTLYVNKDFICIFDDVSRERDGSYSDELERAGILRFFKDEVYYVFDKSNHDELLIEKSIQNSNNFWHSLCVISKGIVKHESTEISDEQLKNICLNAQMIIIGAYDGEGYLFWKMK